MWRLGILPEAPAQEEDKVKEPRRGAREQVQAGQKALPRGANCAGPASFSRSALGDICSATFNLAIAGSSVTEFAGALRPGSEGNSGRRRDGVPQMSAVDFARGGSIWL